MSCTQIYDFIRGTKITLPQLHKDDSKVGPSFDILHPGLAAAELVNSQMKRLEALRGPRGKRQPKAASLLN